MMEIQTIRNLQVQEALQAEELRRMRTENQQRAAEIGAPPQRAPTLKRPDAAIPTGFERMTHGFHNGRFWKMRE